MKTFFQFLAEANAVGSEFEKKTARMVNEWLKKNGLSKTFEAKRFQTVDESDRAEDYSDVVVENRKTGDRFFIECKEADRANVVNMQFDIREDGSLAPVSGSDRKELSERDGEFFAPFVEKIRGSDGYAEFADFIGNGCDVLGGAKPADFYFDRKKIGDRTLAGLIGKYNKLVKSGKTEADCKAFDPGKIRKSTKNMLAVALAWRLSDEDRTWDICKLDSVPDFGKLIRRHYSDGKEEPAKYIQFNDKLFKTCEDDPFKLSDVPVFPDGVRGKFALKFTPRFGTGSVYVTPRSELADELVSEYSFIDRKKWPEAT